MITHVIWDWNGTLLDDFCVTADAAIAGAAAVGAKGVTYDDVRREHTRPFSKYFKALVGREGSPEELDVYGGFYPEMYEAAKYDLALAADALDALSFLEKCSVTQSVLSLAPHAELVDLLDHYGISERFVRVDGAVVLGKIHKLDSLLLHTEKLSASAEQICLIGDTVDDFHAARDMGMKSVLVTTGMNSRERLEATGAPVKSNLLDAVQQATTL